MYQQPQHVYWQPWDELGLEHLILSETDQGLTANSSILRADKHLPFRARYTITTDADHCVRELDLYCEAAGEKRSINLSSNGAGSWKSTGEDFGELEGCYEIDISATPFTNTLPIQRLRLGLQEACHLKVAYIKLPELEVQIVDQRYTCLAKDCYLYEGLFRNFNATLPLDKHRLVIDYPQTFRRLWY